MIIKEVAYRTAREIVDTFDKEVISLSINHQTQNFDIVLSSEVWWDVSTTAYSVMISRPGVIRKGVNIPKRDYSEIVL